MSPTQIRRIGDPVTFFERARAFLLAAETEHSVPLGLESLLRRDRTAFDETPYLALVERDGEVVGCAFRVAPHPLGLTRMPADALPPLVRDAVAGCPGLSSVLGPDAEGRRFAELWVDRRGGSFEIGTRMRIWSAQRLQPPARRCPGGLRAAGSADRELAVGWTVEFAAETGLRTPDPERVVDGWLARGDLFLWEDGAPRAMAAVSAWTPHGARIGYVYTPESWRGRGYATACAYESSRRCLERGRRFCCLYTDLANPTSNAIYRRIGYLPVCDVTEYELTPDDDESSPGACEPGLDAAFDAH